MPTKDGKLPSIKQIIEDAIVLQNEVNRLIREYKKIYEEPGITFFDNIKNEMPYKVYIFTNKEALM